MESYQSFETSSRNFLSRLTHIVFWRREGAETMFKGISIPTLMVRYVDSDLRDPWVSSVILDPKQDCGMWLNRIPTKVRPVFIIISEVKYSPCHLDKT